MSVEYNEINSLLIHTPKKNIVRVINSGEMGWVDTLHALEDQKHLRCITNTGRGETAWNSSVRIDR